MSAADNVLVTLSQETCGAAMLSTLSASSVFMFFRFFVFLVQQVAGISHDKEKTTTTPQKIVNGSVVAIFTIVNRK
jgi:hypothetical protein